MFKTFYVCFLLAIFVGCSGTTLSGKSCSPQVLERIYFGSDSPSGAITNEQWARFLEKEVTPRFPSGLTVFEGNGQWLGNNQKIVHELSRIVEIVHENTPEQGIEIQRIANSYKSQFQQEAVLVLKSDVHACF